MKKSSEEKILPEYFFHLEQIFLGTNIHWQYDVGNPGHGIRHAHICGCGHYEAEAEEKKIFSCIKMCTYIFFCILLLCYLPKEWVKRHI